MKLPFLREIVKEYMDLRKPNHRYASFDYCYNYFHPENRKQRDIDRGCLELFAYLGSWGMFRGSGFLGQDTSFKYLEPLIYYVYECKESCWDIDVNKYNEANIKIILDIAESIRSHIEPSSCIKENKKATTTLITKILLGVFGFVPAFDTRFRETFGGFWSLSELSLMRIHEIYCDNETEIHAILKKKEYSTLVCQNSYTQAKIIDMYGFIRNKNISESQS